jgi:CRP-like cAMP-binding protein
MDKSKRARPLKSAAGLATATAMEPCMILAVEKQDMVRRLHAQPAFADRFLAQMLARNIRIEEDLIDKSWPRWLALAGQLLSVVLRD